VGKTIGLISLKGGVGKTTLSAALAVTLSKYFGKKVLLVDANYSAPNLGIHMNIISPKKTVHDVLNGDKISDAIHEKYGVDVIPGNFMFRKNINPLKLKNKLHYFKRKYDFIILDASPSLNDEVLSTMFASDHLFVVSTADYPTLSCSMKAAKIAKDRNVPIDGIVLNKINKYSIGLQEIQESTGIPVVAKIKDDKIVDYSLHERTPAPLFAKNSNFSVEIRKFASALVGIKEKKSFISKLLGKDIKTERVNREVMREKLYKGVFN
jgi:MinD-like ATPase involved in chromosome partitioning or flagellar assembly